MPDKLDQLLGDGTAAAFIQVLEPTEFRSNVTQYGWYFECDWKDKKGHLWAEIKVEVRSGVVYFQWYRSEDDGTLYKKMCDTIPHLFKVLGCREMMVTPANQTAETELKAYEAAYWEDSGSKIKWPLK